MFRHSSPARVRALPTLVVAALLASGCTKAPPDQPDAKLAIAATPLVGSYQPGDDVSFRVTVSNVGTQDVTRVSVTTTLGANVHERSVACSALGQSATSNWTSPRTSRATRSRSAATAPASRHRSRCSPAVRSTSRDRRPASSRSTTCWPAPRRWTAARRCSSPRAHSSRSSRRSTGRVFQVGLSRTSASTRTCCRAATPRAAGAASR